MDTKMDEYKELKPKQDYILLKSELNYCDFRNCNFDSFESNLNISDIKDEYQKAQEEKITLKQEKKDVSNRNYPDSSFDKDFSAELDNINGDEFNIRKVSICSLQSEEFNCNNKIDNKINKDLKRKITKEDLNNIPLPVFSCIYCSNEKLSFRHLSLEKISNKYLLQSSIYDIIELNKLIGRNSLIDKDDKNGKLLDIIIKNSEYINKYYEKEILNNFFNSNFYLNLCNKELLKYKNNFIHRIEDSVVKKRKDFYFKGINKISKNSLNNKCLFNSTNSLINNFNLLSGFFDTNLINNTNSIGKNNNNNYSNTSLNFNSISSNCNENGNYLNKDSNNLLMSIVEKIENNTESVNEIDDKEEIMDFFKFDLSRKIKKEDIVWENEYYNIWNPYFSDDDIDKNSNLSSKNEKKYNKDLKVNLKSNFNIKQNNSFFNQLNKKLSISQIRDIGSTYSSSEINYETENNLNSYHRNAKDYIKHNNFTFDKENIKKNNSSKNNDIISLKFYNIINNSNNNYIKINQRYNNDSIIVNKPEMNKNYHFSKESNIVGSNNNPIIKRTKNETKILSLNKIQRKDFTKLKFNYISREQNNYISNSYFNSSLSIEHKSTCTGRTIFVKTPNSTKRGTHITSTKITYRQNNIILNSNKVYQKKNFLSSKQNNSQLLTNENITSFNQKINKANEFMKINKPIYQQKNYKKINSSVVISKRCTKINKSQNRLNKESKNGIVIMRNSDNKKVKFKSKTKISINKNKIMLSSSIFKNNISNN